MGGVRKLGVGLTLALYASGLWAWHIMFFLGAARACAMEFAKTILGAFLLLCLAHRCTEAAECHGAVSK